MEWQPIETAPKDGTWVLITGGEPESAVWDGGTPKPRCVVGMWETCPNPAASGWRFAEWEGGLYSHYERPTHWAPLPDPPHSS